MGTPCEVPDPKNVIFKSEFITTKIGVIFFIACSIDYLC
jgi:hypothetical protein